MQLILEAESTETTRLVNGKMSLHQEVVSEKITNGELHNTNGEVLKIDKENKQCHENIITSEKTKTETAEESLAQDEADVTTTSDVSANENGTINGANEESQNEDIILEENKLVANEEVSDETKNDSKTNEVAKKSGNKESSECDNLKENKGNNENENLDDDSSHNDSIDEPLRFEDDDSLDKVVENIPNCVDILNPTISTNGEENTNVPGNQTASSVTEKDKVNVEETNQDESMECDVLVEENTKSEIYGDLDNATEQIKEIAVSNDVSIEKITEPETKYVLDNSTEQIKEFEVSKDVSIEKNTEPETKDHLDNSTEQIKEIEVSKDVSIEENSKQETKCTLDNASEQIKEIEVSDVSLKENAELETKSNLDNDTELIKENEVSKDVSVEENDKPETKSNLDNASEKIKEIEDSEDVSLEENAKPETRSNLDNVTEQIKEIEVTKDGCVASETPMECDDIVDTSHSGEPEDKSSELPKIYDKVPVKDTENAAIDSVNVFEIPIIQNEVSVTDSNNVAESENFFEVPILENDHSAIVSEITPTSSEVIDNKFNVNENKKVEAKTIEKITIEVPDSSTGCNEDVKHQVEKADQTITVDLDEIEDQQEPTPKSPVNKALREPKVSQPVCRLSNNLNILSDDEDEPPKKEQNETKLAATESAEKQCINLDDDDDIVLIDEDTSSKNTEDAAKTDTSTKDVTKLTNLIPDNLSNEPVSDKEPTEEKTAAVENKAEPSVVAEKNADDELYKLKKSKPLLPNDLFKSYKKNFTEMTRNELEEFCILKIVESIIDRSKLNDIRTKLKTMAAHIEDHKKKTMSLTKQNRDLQVVLKSVQEEQKKGGDGPVVPLRITRSVGMQVLMTEKNSRRKAPVAPPGTPITSNNTIVSVNKPSPSPRQQPVRQSPANNRAIPVPKLVLANTSNNNAGKAQNAQSNAKNVAKTTSPNVVKIQSPLKPEKRTHSQSQCATVDLTDDEPPPKVFTRVNAPVRVVPQQNLLAQRPVAAPTTTATPRKVYIPIVQGQVRPGGPVMFKNIPGPRPRSQLVKVSPIPPRNRAPNSRHPAPLPDTVKQYQPPNWKALPPAPDLKLSKVENGIVISWKIEGYLEDSYEEIASYQLYAYQETTAPPSTSLWKKIGDVKALPLPMACTLTQFMAGYKYYFAVRAVDIRSRLGPFSLPGSILLLNKM